MEPISVGEINLLREQNEELRNAYNAILEQCKKEQTENERLKQIPEQYNAYIRGREQQLDAANAKIEKLIRETVILKNVASSAQNAAIHINQMLEKHEEQTKKLEHELSDWITAYKELEEVHDKIQGAYQDDHCENLSLKIAMEKIKQIVYEIKAATYHFGQEADQKFFDETLGKILKVIEETKDETKNT